MWMSEARSLTAWLMSRSTSRTIGASSWTSFILLRRSSSSSVLVAEASALMCSASLSLRWYLLIAAVTASAVATTWRTSAAREGADVVDGEDVGRVGHGDDEPALPPTDRKGQVTPRQRVGHHTGRGRVDRVVGQVDELEAQLLGQSADELLLREQFVLDQHPGEVAAALLRASPTPRSAGRL